MQASRFTQLAEAAAGRYKLLLAGFAHVFETARDAPKPGTPASLKRAAAHAYVLADRFLADEQDQIERAVFGLGESAQRTVADLLGGTFDELDAASQTHLTALADDLDTALRVQLERDVGAILVGLRGVALRARLLTAGASTPRANALQTAAEGMQARFAFLDRAGRRWPSPTYVRTVWRQTLVLAFNEASLLAMAAHGVDTAEITHPDEGHQWAGTRIALDERPALPSWEDVRDDAFHPNSEAVLVPIPNAK